MGTRVCTGLLAVLAFASSALAHHISGTVYCDQDGDAVIDVPGDTPVAGVTVLVTSLDVSPGQQFSDVTDGSGDYNVGLPARTDRYRVQLSGLPGGFSVVLPPGGTYTIQIITASPQDHADGVDFLLQGCAPPPTTTTTKPATTTTSTTTTATTSTTTTTTATTSSSTTTSTSTTSTTTLFFCDCPATPFLGARDVKINNDGDIRGSVGANNLGGRVRVGKNVVAADGTRLSADLVDVGAGASVYDVRANTLSVGPGAVVRGTIGQPSLPLLLPFCGIPSITCGVNDLQLPPGQTLGPLPPGVYGRVRVMNGATLLLQAGDFTFCDLKIGRSAHVTTAGPATLFVRGNVIVGTASTLGPATGTEPVRVFASGKAVRVSQSAVANAAFVAPFARISFGRDARLLGCFCTDRAKSDKHITLECPAP